MNKRCLLLLWLLVPGTSTGALTDVSGQRPVAGFFPYPSV